MNLSTDYHIGTTGKKWTEADKKQWLSEQKVQRLYSEEVLSELDPLSKDLELIQHGTLKTSQRDYPLFVIQSKNWQKNKDNILVTGGVHGYETSGIHGAIRFSKTEIKRYQEQFNFVIFPCISPWGYETINRWSENTIDPNRSFYKNSPSQEASMMMAYLSKLNVEFKMHIDLHETTDSDNSEFRPALATRDAIHQHSWNIPDGFYLVADSAKPEEKFQKAVIDGVKNVTHIAPADDNQQLIGVPLSQFGVINYDARTLGLCMGLTGAPFVTTTEVYPDSPFVDDENCIIAQVATVSVALDFLK
ncbi:M14 family metallocarboxypeptidase [Psychromonas sp. KJ10-10]|uniref:M14 family metallopeptidase n=1 Tax=Psychromonas sp. KJ10-10 TaxID=3391823 RepID=UPI0039B61AB5